MKEQQIVTGYQLVEKKLEASDHIVYYWSRAQTNTPIVGRFIRSIRLPCRTLHHGVSVAQHGFVSAIEVSPGLSGTTVATMYFDLADLTWFEEDGTRCPGQ